MNIQFQNLVIFLDNKPVGAMRWEEGVWVYRINADRFKVHETKYQFAGADFQEARQAISARIKQLVSEEGK